jgi:hypothetical protein
MTDLREISKTPGYDQGATSASKGTIFVFIATFACLAFFSDRSPGLIGGAIFVAVGIFAVSIFISMPLFLLRVKAPRLGRLFSIADFALTVLLTWVVYSSVFTPPAAAGDPFVVTCREPVPQFTLGANSHPSDGDVQRLCACISGKLTGWESDTARAIAEGRERDVSKLNMAAFPDRFGKRIQECGGMAP